MSKRAADTTFLTFGIDRQSGISLERQLYVQLRDAILSGQVKAGVRLPSTRSLAEELGCSRNTVVKAMELLLAEGYIEGRHGSGTYVSILLPDEQTTAPSALAGLTETELTNEFALSKRGEAMAELFDVRPYGDRPFDIGVADVEFFPFKVWGRILGQVWRHPRRELLSYGTPDGFSGLREEVSEYLRQFRGVRCQPEQVFVTSGAQQAFDILSRLLLDPGDEVLVEDPGYVGSRGAFLAAGARIVPVPVDQDGIDLNSMPSGTTRPRAAVVTPSHQFPLGVIMSRDRRVDLLNWAETMKAWIIEDDYDSEFRYTGPPLTSLQGLSAAPTNGKGRVIYVGSFSKILFPGLRLGYMIVPKQLVEKFARARRILDTQYPSLVQPVLAEFLRSGHYATHVRRMRRMYQSRQQALIDAANSLLPDLMDVPPHDAGMHLIGDFTPKLSARMDDRGAAARATRHGIYPRALSEFYVRTPKRQSLLLGYSGMNEDKIRGSVNSLRLALEE